MMHPLFYPFSEAFITSLDSLQNSMISGNGFDERDSYFSLFKSYIKTCRMPFDGAPVKGLQALGFLETRSLSFKRVFFLQTNEDAIPGPSSYDSIIPLKARIEMGLPTYKDRESLAGYYFETLLRGAQEIYLFYADSDRKEPSRYVERLIWQEERGSLGAARPVRNIQYKVRLDSSIPQSIYKDSNTIDLLRQLPYSATSIDAYLRCQLSFFYSYVIRLRQKEDIARDIDRGVIGSFVHQVLREYFEALKGSPLRRERLSEDAIEDLCIRSFKAQFGDNPTGSVYLIMRQTSRRMREILRDYYIPLCNDETVEVLSLEEDIATTFEGFNIKGKIDKVLRRNQRICIVDYKTSWNKKVYDINYERLLLREDWVDAIGTLQLPFYTLLYANSKGISIDNIDGMFLIIGQSELRRDEVELRLSNQEGDRKRLGEIIQELLREIVDPNAPFAPPKDFRKTCAYCEYTAICGTKWAVD